MVVPLERAGASLFSANWRAFLRAPDGHVHTPQDIDEACTAAQAAFAALINWFELRSKAKAIITE